MATSRVLVENWYDYPRYYDIAFQAYTEREADFIEAACQKYCPFGVRRLLEPACGTGRLVTALAARGYQVTGFDLSRPALGYLGRQLARRRLHAETFEAEMSNFRLSRAVDAAYCTVSTFRHLLTEQAARGHLECVAHSLRPGGIYLLGLHLFPLGGDKEHSHCWTQQRCETKVTVTLRVLHTDLGRRVENLQVCMLVCRWSKELRLRHEFPFRTYTRLQFQQLVASVPSLQLCDTYDFRYDIEQLAALNHDAAYTVFVLKRGLPS